VRGIFKILLKSPTQLDTKGNEDMKKEMKKSYFDVKKFEIL